MEVIETKKRKKLVDVDNFKILEKIDSGGFSEIYTAHHKNCSTKIYALKYLKKTNYNIRRIFQEIDALQIINNYQNSVHFYKAGIHNGNIYLVFDYAEKGTLHHYVKQHGPLKGSHFFKLVTDILDQILFARKHNLLHLDISIFNIVFFQGNFSLIDWGLSRFGHSIQTTVIKGHRTYLPPEMYRGKRTFSSELYALGATLFFAATGKIIHNISTQKNPFEQKMFKHLYLEPEYPAHLSGKIRLLLTRMLDKNPLSRATIDEIRTIMNNDTLPPQQQIPQLEPSCPLTPSDTFLMYKKMANDGVSHAQWQLGVFCEKGKYIEQSFPLAKYWYKRAADDGYCPALCSLALLHLNGSLDHGDYKYAFLLFQKAANQGLGKAQYYLAQMFEKGLGTNKDSTTAIYWYKESARNSYKPAITKLNDYHVDIEDIVREDIQHRAGTFDKLASPHLPQVIPLGGDCQLGAALEVYGFKETSLFKWAKISPKQLADALEDRFLKIYDSKTDFYLRPPNGICGIVGDKKDIVLPNDGGWGEYVDYMRIINKFSPQQNFHSAIIDKERGFTHGMLITRSDLEKLSKETIRKKNQEKIDYLKKKTLELIQTSKDNLVFLRAQRHLTPESAQELNRVYAGLKKICAAKSFHFIIATPDNPTKATSMLLDKNIRVVTFTHFSPPKNPMLLRHSYPEWKSLFQELNIPIQGSFKKTILFSGFDT